MTVARIDARFAELKRQGRAGFVAYVMAGDPDAETALGILRGLPAAGADLIELGFPFSDPMAEGVPIQRAAQRALAGRITLRGTLELVRRFRNGQLLPTDVPLLEAIISGRHTEDGRPLVARLAPADPWLVEQAAARGIDIEGFVHTLSSDSARHILRGHGIAGAEAQRGQLPVRSEDLTSLPMLVRSFDHAVFGLRTRRGFNAFALILERLDGSTVAVQVALTGRRRLETQTMWRWPGGVDVTRLSTVAGHNVRNEPQVELDVIKRDRKVKLDGGDEDTPLILMGYLNPLLAYGFDRFARDAAQAGVDGLIVVDCPPEEADPLADALDAEGVALIRLATPTSDDARLNVVTRRTSGFVYYVSVAGVTGTQEADAAAVAPAVERVRRASGLPVAVGFGIRTPERAAEVARVADAAVVGSALIDELASALEAGEPPAPRVLAKARALADAIRSARAHDKASS